MMDEEMVAPTDNRWDMYWAHSMVEMTADLAAASMEMTWADAMAEQLDTR